jgi:hypothetical protein
LVLQKINVIHAKVETAQNQVNAIDILDKYYYNENKSSINSLSNINIFINQ